MCSFKNGKFIISIDFEMMWGLFDYDNIDNNINKIKNIHDVIKELCVIFNNYNIHATWAIVGFIFLENYSKLIKLVDHNDIKYKNNKYNVYNYIKNNKSLISNYQSLHFAPELIDLINRTKYQEIASHTLSHYYAIEDGQGRNDFFRDLDIYNKLLDRRKLKVKSIVFPKNQINKKYYNLLNKYGIDIVRTNPSSYFYSAVKTERELLFRRGVRLIDSYFNLTGHYIYNYNQIDYYSNYGIIELPCSRYLRPVSKYFKYFENFKIDRIKRGMRKSAQENKIFHIWWHPHDFCKNTYYNFVNLKKIFNYFLELKEIYSYESANMTEIENEYKKLG